MDELNSLIQQIDSIDHKQLHELLQKAKSIGLTEILKENRDFTGMIQNKLATLEVDDAIEFIKEYLPVLFESIIEFVNTTEEIKEELGNIEDASLTLKLDNDEFTITLFIKNNTFDFKLDMIEECDLILKMDNDSMKKFIAAEKDPLVIAYKGNVIAEGNLRIILKLRKFFDIIKREFGIEVLGV